MPFRKMHPLQEMCIAGTMRLMMICMLGIASASAFHLTPGSLVQKVCYPFFYLCPGFMTPCETLQVSPLQSLQKCSTQNFLHHVYIFPLSSNHTVPYELFLSVRPSQPFSCITGNTQIFLQLYIADKFDSERSSQISDTLTMLSNPAGVCGPVLLLCKSQVAAVEWNRLN